MVEFKFESRYYSLRMADPIISEEKNEDMLPKPIEGKISWEAAYKAMTEEKEDWSDFDSTINDGLENF